MAKFTSLRDFYSFPDFVPAATVRGVFGDPYAVVIPLRRRRKKQPADTAGQAIAPSTINRLAPPATSTAAAAASIWSFPSDASAAAAARP